MDQLCQGHWQALGWLFEPLAVVLCRGPYSVSLTSQGGQSWTCLGSHRQGVPEQGHSCNLMLGGLLINIY